MGNMSKVSYIDKCRLCQSSEIYDLFTFGLVAPANNYIKPENINKEEEKFTLTTCRCKKCHHIQIRETIDRKSLFSDYLYSSSTSGSLSKYFERYTEEVIDYLKLKPEDGYVLDLGSNDGVTLQPFKNKGFSVLGVEPATNLSKIANDKGIETINNFFDELVAKDILNKYGFPSCIIANNVYAHLSNHDGFTNGVKLLLNNKNFFVFENASLLSTIKGLYFDQIYHDHLGYFWSLPILNYLSIKDLKVVKIQKTPTQGGSIRVFVSKSDTIWEIDDSVYDILNEELDFGLNKPETYDKFWSDLQEIRKIFNGTLNKYILEGKTISCYGCPAKFALFSKFFGLNKENVKFVVEDSKLKQGLYAPESKIPIVSRENFIQNPTDICIISAWNFSELIKNNNPQYKGIWLNPFD